MRQEAGFDVLSRACITSTPGASTFKSFGGRVLELLIYLIILRRVLILITLLQFPLSCMELRIEADGL